MQFSRIATLRWRVHCVLSRQGPSHCFRLTAACRSEEIVLILEMTPVAIQSSDTNPAAYTAT